MRALKKKGIRTIRIRLEEATEAKKKPATASVPLVWLVEVKERWEASGRKDESVFNGFISDWVSHWV